MLHPTASETGTSPEDEMSKQIQEIDEEIDSIREYLSNDGVHVDSISEAQAEIQALQERRRRIIESAA